MAAGKEYPLTLVIKALDKSAGPLRAFTQKLKGITAPFKAFGRDFSEFSKAAQLAQIGTAFKGVGREAFALGAKIFAMAGVAGFALFSIVKGAEAAGSELEDSAARVGLSIDAYASLQHAAKLAGVEQDGFTKAMDQFNKRLGDMKANTGPLLGFLNKVSPTLGKQIRAAKTNEEALSLMTDAMVKIKDPAKRAAFAAAAFGRSGMQMGNFLNQGSAAIQEQMRSYMKLAGSQEAYARASGKLGDEFDRFEIAGQGLRAALMGGLFPAFTELTKVLTGFLVANRDEIAKWATETGAAITAWVKSGGMERLGADLREFGKDVAWLFGKVGGLKGSLVILAAVMAGPLIAAVVSLTVAMLPLLIAGGLFTVAALALAAAGIWIWQAWEPISALFRDLSNASAGLREMLAGIVTLDMGRIVGGWTQMIDGFRESIISALAVLGTLPGGGMVIDLMARNGTLAALAPPMGAEAARVDPAGVSSREPSRVEVNFSRVPPGVEITAEGSSSQPIDLSVGRSMMP